MKKLLLFVAATSLGLSLTAQQVYHFKIDTKERTAIRQVPKQTHHGQSTTNFNTEKRPQKITPSADRDPNIVNIIGIGTSANAYNTYSAQRSFLWVEPALNTVTYFHNMGGALDSTGFSGNLGYDISTNGGNTFTNMVQCYETYDTINYTDASRYPNHAIYNPSGNTDPANAYVVFLAANSDTTGGNGNTGYSYGVDDIGTPSSHTKHQMTSHDDYYLCAPTGFELTSQGTVFAVNENIKSTTGEYQGNLTVTKGVWDDTTSDFVYTQSLIEAPVVAGLESPVFAQVAFGQDGNTGYIVMLGDNGSAEQPGGFFGLYPIYWETTDAGETWAGPYFVQLDGPNGLEGIVYYLLTDAMIENLFGVPAPDRTEINYTTAFDFDCSVDKLNNLHIAVVIGPTGTAPYSIITLKDYIAVVDIFDYDNANKWYCAEMGRLNTFRGYFGDLYCDNRVQISTTSDREELFISWLDTDFPNADENNMPNIFCRGINPITWKKTCSNGADYDGPENVTLFSDGMWQSYFFSAPEYCFSDNDTYNIPFVYEDIDTTDLSQPVQFNYIQDFSFNSMDFAIPLIYVGVNELASPEGLTVSQNYPNPFKGNTYITISLRKKTNVSLEIFTQTGQKVSIKDYGFLIAGRHKLIISSNKLKAGVYLYTVKAGASKVVRKMVIR